VVAWVTTDDLPPHSVNRIVKSDAPKVIEIEKVRDPDAGDRKGEVGDSKRERIARRAAKEFADGVSLPLPPPLCVVANVWIGRS
jgi:hypothetical protein